MSEKAPQMSSAVVMERPSSDTDGRTEVLKEKLFEKGQYVRLQFLEGNPEGLPVTHTISGELMSAAYVGGRVIFDGYMTEIITNIEIDKPSEGMVHITTEDGTTFSVWNVEAARRQSEVASTADEMSAETAIRTELKKPKEGWLTRLRKATKDQWSNILTRPEAVNHSKFLTSPQVQHGVFGSPKHEVRDHGNFTEKARNERSGEMLFAAGQSILIEQLTPAREGARRSLLESTVQGPALTGVFIGRPLYLDGFTTAQITEATRDPSNSQRTHITTKDGATYAIYATHTAESKSQSEAADETASVLENIRQNIDNPITPKKRSWFSWFR